MHGQWQSQTRRLNRHYQSVDDLGVFNANLFKSLLSYKSPSFGSKLKYLSQLGKIGDDNMYIVKASGTLDGIIKDAGNKDAVVGNYNTVPIKLIANSGEALQNFYDRDNRLDGTDDKFYGEQITAVFLNQEYRAKDLEYDVKNFWYASNDNYNTNNPYPINLDQDYGGSASSQVFELHADPKIKLIKWFEALTSSSKHDASQLGNKEYIGSALPTSGGYNVFNYPSSKVELTGGVSLDDQTGATITLTKGIANQDYTGNKAIDYLLPFIGSTVFSTITKNTYGKNAYLFYFVTPTIFDENGNVAQLEH